MNAPLPSAVKPPVRTTQPLRIAVLGIGLMGLPMARRLCQAGHEVHVWNRSAAKAHALLADGAQIHTTPLSACAHADITISMLENGSVVAKVLFEMQEDSACLGMASGSLFIDMASIQPAEARVHAAQLQTRGISALDAPVSGGTVGAEAGTLAIMAGGYATDMARAQPIFDVLGRAVHVGPCGAGQLAKLANQMIVGITIGAVAEALLLASQGGADMAKVREAMLGGFADSRILQLHGQRMIDRDFTPRGRMTVQLKDLSNALATAQDLGFDAPITQLFTQLYADGVNRGLDNQDHSALFLELARRNGLER